MDRFRELSQLVDQHIGTPEVVGVWSKGDFGKFKIHKLQYTIHYSPIFADTADEPRSLTL